MTENFPDNLPHHPGGESESQAPPWQATYYVGVTTSNGIFAGGSVAIAPGYVTFAPSRPTRWAGGTKSVIAMPAPRHLRVYVARLVPPWFNVSMTIASPEGTCTIVLPAWMRRSFVTRLNAAGFEVAVVKTWLRNARWTPGA